MDTLAWSQIRQFLVFQIMPKILKEQFIVTERFSQHAVSYKPALSYGKQPTTNSNYLLSQNIVPTHRRRVIAPFHKKWNTLHLLVWTPIQNYSWSTKNVVHTCFMCIFLIILQNIISHDVFPTEKLDTNPPHGFVPATRQQCNSPSQALLRTVLSCFLLVLVGSSLIAAIPHIGNTVSIWWFINRMNLCTWEDLLPIKISRLVFTKEVLISIPLYLKRALDHVPCFSQQTTMTASIIYSLSLHLNIIQQQSFSYRRSFLLVIKISVFSHQPKLKAPHLFSAFHALLSLHILILILLQQLKCWLANYKDQNCISITHLFVFLSRLITWCCYSSNSQMEKHCSIKRNS